MTAMTAELPTAVHATDTGIKIPENFAIGAGVSAYQVEGAWNVDDKGESNYDRRFANNTQNGTVACDFYHKYKEDIQIAKDIGLKHFRISLSWTRILRTGRLHHISKAGIQFYHNVIDEIRANGMEPIVTIYHWDHPLFFDQFDSWLDEQMINFFADYARVVFQNFGPKVKFWTTINEPNLYCSRILRSRVNASEERKFRCGYTMLKAHAKVYHLYDEEFRASQHGKIGISNACQPAIPADLQSRSCRFTAFDDECGWALNPIFSEKGDWPESIKSLYYGNRKLPSFTPEEIKYIRNTSDYLGLTYYTADLCQNVPNYNWRTNRSLQMSKFKNRTWEQEDGSFVYTAPEGLRLLLNTIKKEYNNPLVYILENGCPNNQGLNDVRKINYLYSHMKEAILAREVDGCNVEKYMVWSFLDSFEWRNGFSKKWGLVQVDFNSANLTRTPRLSAKWLKKVITDRELIEYHDEMEL
ncbi:myrosinase 1-like [Aphidius gifuensis]|uniref:myrosinase 1-like n=1 Tax=Aphidius gifuensis TaxID=684658 RepID=UPI001CDC9457|nr:myrosinase 1-like [Aphidius gifuensis]